jgi:hypothetical protein
MTADDIRTYLEHDRKLLAEFRDAVEPGDDGERLRFVTLICDYGIATEDGGYAYAEETLTGDWRITRQPDKFASDDEAITWARNEAISHIKARAKEMIADLEDKVAQLSAL